MVSLKQLTVENLGKCREIQCAIIVQIAACGHYSAKIKIVKFTVYTYVFSNGNIYWFLQVK